MIWHEMVCDDCHITLPGYSGIRSYNSILKEDAKHSGWRVEKNGYALCPECQKREAKNNGR